MASQFNQTGRVLAAAALLASVISGPISQTAKASDLLRAPVRIKRFSSFQKCLADLRLRQADAAAKAGTQVTEDEQGRQTIQTTVTAVQTPEPQRAQFSQNSVSSFQPKSREVGGGRVGFGTDWWCKGAVLWQGGGNSAWVQDPPPPPEPPMPPPLCNGVYWVEFDWNRFDLSEQAASTLDRAVRDFAACSDRKIVLTGHTDSSGSAAYNRKLAARRNQAVREYLVSHGLPATVFVDQPVGEALPAQITPDGKREARNRRVDLQFSK